MTRTHYFFDKPSLKTDPMIKNLNDLEKEHLMVGQRLADRTVRFMGSWKFIIIQSIILSIWTILNIVAWHQHWDPYPFILLNLFLSMQAAYTAPIIMMSQNRQAERDRLEAHNDYLINKKAEQEIRTILNRLEMQNEKIDMLQTLLLDLKKMTFPHKEKNIIA
jgi:uncharacterized membrane protein